MESFHFVFLIFSMSFQLFLQTDALGNETDRISLLEFKQGIASDPNKIFASWNNTIPFCSWVGITCSRRHNRVTSLVLEGQDLLGTVSPFIGNLSFLRTINLRNNTFRGEIPLEVGRLFRLQQFLLNNNTLQGRIPSNLSRCSDLRLISLQWNKLSGNIPTEFGSLTKLTSLQLFVNNLTGDIPASLGNLSSLNVFHVSRNNLVGNIPDELGRLRNLITFGVGVNRLSGIIPPSVFNISSMVNFEVIGNSFNGSLPETLGLTMPNLQFFGFGENDFVGSIPKTLSNSSRLALIDLGWNNFVGEVPTNLGNMKDLWRIRLHGNDLGSNSTNDLGFITSLTNCTKLKILDFGRNNLGGEFPDSVENLSTQLNLFYFGFNYIRSNIPPGLENLVNLTGLVMNYNLFTGPIPSFFGKFQKMQVLSVSGNRLSGQIPSSLFNLTGLSELYLLKNNLQGTIPETIGNLKNLNIFSVSQNNLSGPLPRELLLISSLSLELDLSGNFFTGSLPREIGKLTSLTTLDISRNNLSGSIPSSIGDCSSLEYLYMQDNSFQGNIPSSIDSLKGLKVLDLSGNSLTGRIVESLQNFQFLTYLNLSFNDLEGEVPKKGIFINSSAFSLIGNSNLCGGIPELNLPKCPEIVTKKGKSLAFKPALIIPFVVLAVLMMLVFLFVYCKRKSDEKSSSTSPTNRIGKRDSFSMSLIMNRIVLKVPYRDLHQATNGFSSTNLIGSGNFGSVYKGYLNQVQGPVAIKVLTLETKGASKSFLAECKVLRNARHRNLVKLLTYCSSVDYRSNEFKALVFEYMGNGSLDTWLHPENIRDEKQPKSLNLLERINVAIDVASALHYLHDLCKIPIIHNDLKPSNVLLDDNMVARVCDFGLSRLLSCSNSVSQSEFSTIGVKGTIGYAAPEYGMGSGVSKGGDVYSYGILLLEMFSGKRPTDKMFEGGLNLHNFVKGGLGENLLQIVDPKLLVEETAETKTERMLGKEEDEKSIVDEDGNKLSKIAEMVLVSIVEIGLMCSAESSKNRMRMADVLDELQLIKNSFLES